MTPNEYQQLASRTDPDRTDQVVAKIVDDEPNGSWLLHAQIGLAGEVGELAAAIQKWLYYGKPLDRTNVIEELGDLCWYLAQACRAMDVKLEDVMKANIKKLELRYPEKYTDFHAAEENRDRAAERAVLELDGDNVEEINKILAADAYRRESTDAMEFIKQQTGPRPATPICPKCKTVVSKHGYCPECKVRTV